MPIHPRRGGGKPGAVGQLDHAVAGFEAGSLQGRVQHLGRAPGASGVFAAQRDELHLGVAEPGRVDEPEVWVVAEIPAAEAHQRAVGGPAQAQRVRGRARQVLLQDPRGGGPGSTAVLRPAEVGGIVQTLGRGSDVVRAEPLFATQVNQRRMPGVGGTKLRPGVAVDEAGLLDADHLRSSLVSVALLRGPAAVPGHCSRMTDGSVTARVAVQHRAVPPAAGSEARRLPPVCQGARRAMEYGGSLQTGALEFVPDPRRA